MPHELEPEQIAMLVRAFGDAARRCRDGGLDGVELSFAHNHLVDQFWSPLFNQRPDEYGGSLDNRMRFGFEVLREIRRQVGRDCVVGARISGRRAAADGGLTAADMAEIARRLAASGLVDFLSIIGGAAHTYALQAAAVPNMSLTARPSSCRWPPRIKAAVPGMPIFHASAHRRSRPRRPDPRRRGQVDVVGMTRALIADPDLPRKAREGRLDDIRICVGANEGCIDRIYQGKPVTCIQNPATGREAELGEVDARRRRGGRSWWSAAAWPGSRRRAWRRSAAIAWCSSRRAPRSAARSCSRPARPRAPSTPASSASWRVRSASSTSRCRLGVEATRSPVLAEQPDVVIVATGSHPHVPPLPGLDGKHVVTDRDVLPRPRRRSGERVRRGRRRAHPAGALDRRAACSTEGKRVEVISRLFYAGQDVGVTSIAPLYARLFAKGVVLTPHTELVAPSRARR